MLKESGRERINAVYGTKEQCRKEFQDEISRLRNQFQLVRREELSQSIRRRFNKLVQSQSCVIFFFFSFLLIVIV